MGADLLMATLTWDADRKLDWKAGHEAIDELKPDEDGHLECDTSLELTKEQFHDVLDNVKQAVAGDFRDADVMCIGHLNVLYSGGMSFGDSPAETFDAINVLGEFSSVSEAVGFDLLEDAINYKKVVGQLMKNRTTWPLLLGLDKELDKILEQKLKGARK